MCNDERDYVAPLRLRVEERITKQAPGSRVWAIRQAIRKIVVVHPRGMAPPGRD